MKIRYLYLIVRLILSMTLLMGCQIYFEATSDTDTTSKDGDSSVQPIETPQPPINTPQPPTNTPTASECTNDSAFESDVTILDGTEMEAGEHFTKTWRIENNGSCTWTTSYQFVFIDGERMGAPQSISPISQDVAPNETIDISITFTAPTEPGSYRSRWQLRAADGTLFGRRPYVRITVKEPNVPPTPTEVVPTNTPPSTPTVTHTPTVLPPTNTPTASTASGCTNDSAFESDVTILDGTEMKAGEHFTKTWRIENNGSCTWTTSYQFVFIDGEQMGAPLSVSPISQDVAPNETIDISITFTAPTEQGSYRSRWQLQAPDGTLFGRRPYVRITVKEPNAPPTQTEVVPTTNGEIEAHIDLKTFSDITVRNLDGNTTVPYEEVASIHDTQTPFTALARSPDDTWIYVRLQDGTLGWIASEFVVATQPLEQLPLRTPAAPPEIRAHIDLKTFEFINVRSGPSKSYGEVSRLNSPNIYFMALGLSQDADWVFVRLEDGTQGWISGEFVVSDKPLDQLPKRAP